MGDGIPSFLQKTVRLAERTSPRLEQPEHLQPQSPTSTFTPTPTPTRPTSTEPCKKTPAAATLSSRNVLLSDWWLVAEKGSDDGKRLAVGGMVYTGPRISRVFTSAPIAKRIDAYTLETTDGITVIIVGIINKGRTRSNGFPSEACAHFEIGFPYNWDAYAGDYFAKEPSCKNDKQSVCKFANSAARNISPASPTPENGDLNYNILGVLKQALYDAFKTSRSTTDIVQATSSHTSQTYTSKLCSGIEALTGSPNEKTFLSCTKKQSSHELKTTNSFTASEDEIIDQGKDNSVKEKFCAQGTSHADGVQLEDHAADMVDNTETNLHDSETTSTTKNQLDDDLDELTPREVHVPRRSARLQKVEETTPKTTDTVQATSSHTSQAYMSELRSGIEALTGSPNEKTFLSYTKKESSHEMKTTKSFTASVDEIIDQGKDNSVKEKFCDQGTSHTDGVLLENHAADMVDNTEPNLHDGETTSTTKSQLDDDLDELTPREVHVLRRSARLRKVEETTPKTTDTVQATSSHTSQAYMSELRSGIEALTGSPNEKTFLSYTNKESSHELKTTKSFTASVDEIIDKGKDNSVKEKFCDQGTSHTDGVLLEDHAADMVDNTEPNLHDGETTSTIKNQLDDDLDELTPRQVHVPRRSARLREVEETTPKTHSDVDLLGKSFTKITENSSQNMCHNIFIEENMQSRGFSEAAIKIQQETLSTLKKDRKQRGRTVAVLMADQAIGIVGKFEANLHDGQTTSTVKIQLDDELDTPRAVHIPRRSARLQKVEEATQNTPEVKTEAYAQSPVSVQFGIGKAGKSREKRVNKSYHSPVRQDPKERVTRSLASPELLDLKRSRSGRVLVPRLDVSQNITYAMNGAIIGVTTTCYDKKTDLPPSSPKKRRRHGHSQ